MRSVREFFRGVTGVCCSVREHQPFRTVKVKNHSLSVLFLVFFIKCDLRLEKVQKNSDFRAHTLCLVVIAYISGGTAENLYNQIFSWVLIESFVRFFVVDSRAKWSSRESTLSFYCVCVCPVGRRIWDVHAEGAIVNAGWIECELSCPTVSN